MAGVLDAQVLLIHKYNTLFNHLSHTLTRPLNPISTHPHTHYQHAHQHTLSTPSQSLINTPSHTLSTHPLTHPLTPYQHTLSHTLLTNPTTPFPFPAVNKWRAPSPS